MKIADLFIKLGLKKDGFDSGLDKSKSKVRSFSKAIKKIGALIAGAFAVSTIVNFTKEALNAYNVQAQSEQQLLTALKGREDVQGELIKQAQKLQGITLYGDEETIRAQALIAAFVKEKDQIKAIIPLVQDLATAKQMSLAGAADLVAKTLGSSTNALSRYGIEVTGAVGSTERLSSLMDGLNKAFGGQAAAAANTGTGALTQLQNAMGDLREEIGKLIASSKGFITYLKGSTEEVQTWSTIIADEDMNGFKKLWLFLTGSKKKWKEVADAANEANKAQNEGTDTDAPEYPNLLDEVTINQEPASYIDALNSLLSDTKDELSTLMGTGGKWHGEESADAFINKVDELNNKIDSLKKKIKELSGPTIANVDIDLSSALSDADAKTKEFYDDLQTWADENIKIGIGAENIEIADITGIEDKVDMFVQDLNAAFESGIENGIVDIGSIIGEAIGSGDWSDFGSDILSVIGNFMVQIGALIIAYGVAMDAFKKALSNPIAAIAAGTALVILGSAISSMASSTPTSTSSSYSSSSYSSSSDSSASSAVGDVVFVLEGSKLIGAIDNTKRRRSITG